MIKTVIRLMKPGVFLPCFVSEQDSSDKVLVRPRYLSICAADQRYFRGNRPPAVLAKKLPMALVHEAIGIVLHDPDHILKKGQEVVLLPCGIDNGESNSNYQDNAFFRSSTTDGFCQEMLYLDRREMIPIPSEHSPIYVFSELLSVCCHALRRMESLCFTLDAGPKRIGIWGDGIMGYMMALTLHILKPEWELFIFGRHDEKLMMFSFANKKINVLDKLQNIQVDAAIECVGGEKAEYALNHILHCIRPCGAIVLMGVSETPPRIPTRTILEKGLALLGTSRSQREDFEKAVSIIARPTVKPALEKMISRSMPVTNHIDLHDAFMQDTKQQFKTVVYFAI